MRYQDFEAMVAAMATDVPQEFLDGIESIEVTAKTVPHPARRDVYTLGECVPHVWTDETGQAIRSSVLLHHGSFAALARITAGFDWRHEAWETLTHELRHHLEWRANVPALEALDEAAEANYARHDGEPFEPLFFLDGERLADGVTKVEDDVFYDVELSAADFERAFGTTRRIVWHGRDFTATVPDWRDAAATRAAPTVLFLTLEGLDPEPAGEVLLVIRRRPGARDLLRRAEVRAGPLRVTPAPEC